VRDEEDEVGTETADEGEEVIEVASESNRNFQTSSCSLSARLGSLPSESSDSSEQHRGYRHNMRHACTCKTYVMLYKGMRKGQGRPREMERNTRERT
jgi:hypothetical protein